MVDANAAYTLADADHLARLDRVRPDDDRAAARLRRRRCDHAALQRRLKTPICLDESIKTVPIARDAHRRRRLPHHQHQAGPRRRLRGIDRAARSLRRARHSGVARRHARVGHRPRRQHSPVHACRTFAARRHRRRASATSIPISSIRRSRSPPTARLPVPRGPWHRRGDPARIGSTARPFAATHLGGRRSRDRRHDAG